MRVALRLATTCFVMLALGFAASSTATAQTPVSLGQMTSGEIVDAAQIDTWSFSVAPGDVAYVYRVDSSNPNQLNWYLDDAYGRRITENLTALNDLGPVALMGGDYVLSVLTEGGGLGTYDFVVYRTNDRSAALTLDVPVVGEIENPGDTYAYTFTLPTDGRVFLDKVATSNNGFLNWTLVDSRGQVFLPLTTNLDDVGTLGLPSGDYTLTIQGESGGVGTYEFVMAASEIVEPVLSSLDTPVDAEIGAPAEERSYEFDIATAGPYFFDFISSTSAANLNVRITHGDQQRVVLPWTTHLQDEGPWHFAAGRHRVEIRGEGQTTADFSFQLATVRVP